MLKQFLISLALLFSLSLWAQDKIVVNGLDFLKVKEGLYISKQEISKKQYNAFLKERGINNYTAIHDSGWVQGEAFQKSFFEATYFSNAYSHKYDNHPVVNIYQDGAKAYCDWLTEKYKLEDSILKMQFRLPSEKEWKLAEKKFKNKDIKHERIADAPLKPDTMWKKFNIDPENPNPEDFLPDSKIMKYIYSDEWFPKLHSWPVRHYEDEGEVTIYHLRGNVSEWTSEKDVAIGGNWMTQSLPESKERLISNQYSPLIGFRVFMVVLDKPTK